MNAPEKFVVGLTGGIGSGKSAAAEVFRSLGIDVINADDLAREVVEPGQPALQSIADHFGRDMLNSDGSLNRPAMRTSVFSNSANKAWLEALLHPLIAELIQRRIEASNSPYTVLETPLLLETTQHEMVDRILAIDVSEDTQLQRAMQRDGSDADTIRSIIASQIERRARIASADDIVSNEGDLETLRGHIEQLHEKYTGLAKQ